MYFRSWLRQNYKTSQGSYQNLNMNTINNKTIKTLPQRTEIEQNRERLLQKFSTAEKNCKGFKRRERSKIGKDCQHTWKDLSLTTSRERLIVPCMAAITLTTTNRKIMFQ